MTTSGANAADVQPYQEYAKRVHSAEHVSPLTDALFGESVNLYNGQTEFSQVDISIPGNDALPVQLVRRLSVEAIPYRMVPDKLFGAGDWDVDVPYITGMFDGFYKWNVDVAGLSSPRCSTPFFPGTSSNVRINDIFSGYTIHIPGAGNKSLMGRSNAAAPQPNDGQVHRWMTQDFDAFSCTSTTKNGYPGEGFVMHTPDGLKYTFDVALEKFPGSINSMGVSRPRVRIYMLASKIEDRFGNKVEYTYDGNGHPTLIQANDGRSISLQYVDGRLVSATAAGRTWTYAYTNGLLTSVQQPDGQAWTFATGGRLQLSKVTIDWRMDKYCSMQPPIEPDKYSIRMTHPSGAAGEFNFDYLRHDRSGVSVRSCVVDMPGSGGDPPLYSLAVPYFFDVYSLGKKTISGPGLSAPMTWTYLYQAPPTQPIAGAPGTCTDEAVCPSSKKTVVTDPSGGKTESIFGMRFFFNDGRPLGSRTLAADGTVLRTETIEYLTDAEMSGQPFPDFFGGIWGGDDNRATFLRPLKRRVITQDPGPTDMTTFEYRVDRYDSWARPVEVSRFSSLGASRSESSTYHDDLVRWIVGRPQSVTCTAPATCAGKVISQTDYDPTTALPLRTYSFGQLQSAFTYHPNGALATVADAKNNTTTLTDWKRGIPQAIRHPDGSTESAEVDDHGWIRSVTDEDGSRTAYDYDNMGRLTLIDYPDEDSLSWNNTVSSFVPITSAEYGIPAGHWKQTVSTGSARKVIYFDALWRPVVEERYDAGAVAGTLSQTVKGYDAKGRMAFQSYPLRGLADFANVAQGARTVYDALDRVTRTEQDSELGPLVTQTEYLPGLRTRVTSPRGTTTTTSFIAFDEPSEDWPVLIASPEGAYTDITRNAFGKPLLIRRRNVDSTVAVTRQYVYDAQERLCKAIEPETGATAMGYDAVGNLEWSASGLSLSDPSNCSASEAYASEQRAQRTYDSRNRLIGLAFSDGNGNQSLSYWPDGAIKQIDTSNMVDEAPVIATNSYEYNKRGLLTRETLIFDGQTSKLDYQYDVNGNLAGHTYPSGLNVSYAPNALGQPTQAGSYASGVEYYPNGGMAQFTYGNGLLHTLTQNARGLPERSRDASSGTAVLDDSYDYDANGNVAAISDALPGNRGNRDMTYDGLDRLLTATSPMFGAASYSYDVLDNLKRVKAGARDHTYVYDASNRLTNVMAQAETVIGLGYDVQGNLENKSGQKFDFDFGNRLRSAGTEAYRYDGHGRRVQAVDAVKGAINSFYDQAGVLRQQHNRREAKAIEYITLNGSLVAKVSRLASPAAPIISVPDFSANGVFTVAWNAVPGATLFNLQESVDGGSWQPAYTGSGRSMQTSDRVNGAYTYRAQACNTAGCGPWGEPATVFVRRPPSAPAGITVPTEGPSGAYTISWLPPLMAPSNDANTGVTTYVLEERFNSGTWTTAYSGGAALTKAFSGKQAGLYAYRVKACNPYGCGPEISGANQVEVQYPPATPALTVPASSLNGSYVVSWTAVSGATNYLLDEAVNGGAFARIQDSAGTSISLSGRQTATYSYRVTACRQRFGCSAPSPVGTITVVVPPTSAPWLTATTANSYNGSYSLGWNAVATADRYELFERVNGGAYSLVYSGGAGSWTANGRGTAAWEYKVRACNISNCGPESNVVAIQVLLPPATPVIYDSVRLTSTRPVYVQCSLAWTAVAHAATYELRDVGGSTVYSGPLHIVSAKGALPYCSSSHTVRACNAAGCSPWSDPPIPQLRETTSDI